VNHLSKNVTFFTYMLHKREQMVITNNSACVNSNFVQSDM